MANSIMHGQVAATNIDSLNKTGKAAVALQNGYVVALGAMDSDGVYAVAAPAAAATDTIYMVKSPVNVKVSGYSGLTDDPTLFELAIGQLADVYKPMVGDEIEISTDGIGGTKGVNTYLVAADGELKLQWAVDGTGSSIAYELIGETLIDVPGATFYSSKIQGYKFRCVKA